MSAAGRFGALAERNFRLFFASVGVSSFGDAVATIALAFAVLSVSNSPIALGVVLAGRQLAQAAIVLAAGVWADRLPRHLVLVAAATVQGTAQAATGTLVVTGHATVPRLVALAVVYGLADGFVIPASQGLIPLTISASRLQQGNALIGLTRSIVQVVGPAVGGVVVALGSPGTALLVDAATFFAAALLLVRLSVPPREPVEATSFLAELRAGWAEFRRQTWIWTTIVFFGIANCAFSAYFVLGPVIAKRDYDGAATWATLSTSFGIGTVVGGLVALRIRPARPLFVACLTPVGVVIQPLGLALGLPVQALAPLAALSGVGLSIHLALWFTVFQQQVPAEARSRVSSYDALGSFVLAPVGFVLAGPIAHAVGARATLAGAAAICAVCCVVVCAQPSVWAIEAAPQPEPVPA